MKKGHWDLDKNFASLHFEGKLNCSWATFGIGMVQPTADQTFQPSEPPEAASHQDCGKPLPKPSNHQSLQEAAPFHHHQSSWPNASLGCWACHFKPRPMHLTANRSRSQTSCLHSRCFGRLSCSNTCCHCCRSTTHHNPCCNSNSGTGKSPQ